LLFKEIQSIKVERIPIHAMFLDMSDSIIAGNLTISIKNDKPRDPSYFEHFLKTLAGLRIREGNSKPRHFGEVCIEGFIVSVRRNEDHLKAPFG
jgi:hypothetical protein